MPKVLMVTVPGKFSSSIEGTFKIAQLTYDLYAVVYCIDQYNFFYQLNLGGFWLFIDPASPKYNRFGLNFDFKVGEEIRIHSLFYVVTGKPSDLTLPSDFFLCENYIYTGS